MQGGYGKKEALKSGRSVTVTWHRRSSRSVHHKWTKINRIDTKKEKKDTIQLIKVHLIFMFFSTNIHLKSNSGDLSNSSISE